MLPKGGVTKCATKAGNTSSDAKALVTPTLVTVTLLTPSLATPSLVTPPLVTPTLVTVTLVTLPLVPPPLVTPTSVTLTFTAVCAGNGCEFEQDPGLSDNTVRFWCPELTQEGQWHHLMLIFHRAGIMKNSSVSLFVDGDHVDTQKVSSYCDLAEQKECGPCVHP